MAFSKDSLKIDAAAVADDMAQTILKQIRDVLKKGGAVIGVSGGIDSSTIAALCVKALGPRRVLGVMMPEKESAGESEMLAGKLGDKFGHKRILLFSLVSAGLISIPQSFANNLTILFIERCLFGLAVGGILPSIHVLVSNIIPREKVGGAYGLTSSVICLGIGTGPLIGGTMASIMGLRMPFAAMGFLAIVIAVIVKKMIVDIDYHDS